MPAISIVSDQNIDGSSFLELTAEDFVDMKIKIGPKRNLLKIIREAKATRNVSLTRNF